MRSNPRSHHPPCGCQCDPIIRLDGDRGEHYVGADHVLTCYVMQAGAIDESRGANGEKTVRRCMAGCGHWHAYDKTYVRAIEKAVR